MIERRLAEARLEMAAEDEFDSVLTNASVPEAAARLVALLDLD